MIARARWMALAALTGAASACDGQQYVGPDTLQIAVLRDAEPVLQRCNFVPVLLGSRLEERVSFARDSELVVALHRDAAVFEFIAPDFAQTWTVALDGDEVAPLTFTSQGSDFSIGMTYGCQP